MNIIVNRNGQRFGPYTIEQANTYLLSGQLLPTDLAWHEGSLQWVPLCSVQGITELPPAPPPPIYKRNILKLILMAIVWSIVFWIGSLLIAGAIAGSLNPEDPSNAGRKVGESFSGIFLLISLCLSIGLTIAGKLPGTKKS
jgi:hypothetical protein